jgi:soluble lytic murein transglycosylase
MPNIPLYPAGGTTAPAPLPGPRFSGGSPADFGAISAAQTEQLGAQAEHLANEQIMLQNQVRVNDALNQARQKALDLTYDPQLGYLSQRGRAVLDRSSGQALPDEYGGRLGDAVSEISANLTPQQQRVFQMQAAPILSSFREGVQKHQLQESNAYAMSVQESTMKLAGDTAAQHWDDPEQIGQQVESAKAAAYATGKLTGMDVSAAILEAGSHIHSRVVEAALENSNPLYAVNYLQAHSKEMTSDDLLRAQGRVNQQADAQISMLAVDGAMKGIQTAAAPTDMDRLTGLVAHQESGGRETNADGTTVTSPKGAKGLMQVMDTTAGAPGFGIAPAKKLPDGSFDPADRARVGRQYLGALLQKYGSVPAALAAYNAGPAVVDKAIDEAQKRGEPAATGLWLQDPSIPKETRNYVAAIMGKYEAGAGAASLPTKLEFVQAAESKLGPNPRPQTLLLTRQRAEQQYELMTTSRHEDTEAAVRDVQNAIIDANGDFAAVQQQHPDLISRVRGLDPGRMDNLLQFAKTFAKGERTDNMEAYAAAWGHPEEMAAMTDSQFNQFVRTNFTDATGKELIKRREDFAEGKVDGGVGAVNDQALKQTLDERLRNAGKKWMEPKASTDDKNSYGTVAKFLRDGIFQAQREAGRKFTPEEVGKYVDQQFQRTENTSRWFGLSTKTQYELAISYDDVPSNIRAAIDAKLPNASPGDKLRVYWTWKGNQAKGAQTANAQ